MCLDRHYSKNVFLGLREAVLKRGIPSKSQEGFFFFYNYNAFSVLHIQGRKTI